MANAAIAQLKQFASALFPKLRINVIAYPAIEGTYMIEAYKRKTGQSFPTISISKAYQKLKKYLV